MSTKPLTPCSRHLITSCPVCPPEQQAGRVDGWTRLGMILGTVIGAVGRFIGRFLLDTLEWALYGFVFGSFAWLTMAISGHAGLLPYAVCFGGAIGLRVLVLGVRNAWEAPDRAQAKANTTGRSSG